MTVAPTPATMTLTHLCAWRIVGGLGMPASSTTVPLASGVPVIELSDLLMKYLAAHAAQVLGTQKGN